MVVAVWSRRTKLAITEDAKKIQLKAGTSFQ
jgi:hypothetical protein